MDDDDDDGGFGDCDDTEDVDFHGSKKDPQANKYKNALFDPGKFSKHGGLLWACC